MVNEIDRFDEVAPEWLRANMTAHPLRYVQPLPIQRVLLPQVCAALASGIHFDVCLSAPTGAGKTLCYLLPLIRHIHRMKAHFGDTQFRGVVLVPTKALGHQVTGIAKALAGPNISVALCCGDDRDSRALTRTVRFPDGDVRTYAAADLIIATPQKFMKQLLMPHAELVGQAPQPSQPGAADKEDPSDSMAFGGDLQQQQRRSGAGLGPLGNLGAHESGDGTLAHLLAHVEMIVVDEADELLTGNFSAFACRIATAIDGAVEESYSGRPVHKMLCSATLTSRIANISELRLRNAKAYALDADGGQDEEAAAGAADAPITEGGRVRCTLGLPEGLEEHSVIVRHEEQRHAVLLRVVRHILAELQMPEAVAPAAAAPAAPEVDTAADVPGEASSSSAKPADADDGDDEQPAAKPTSSTAGAKQQGRRKQASYKTILVFAASTDQARVLSHFLAHAGLRALEFTTAASESERRQAVMAAYTGQDSVVVATDALMRGIDLPGVSAVVMYDAPRTLQQYVHRIGRTARAGRRGHSFALLSREGVSGTKEDGEVAIFKSFYPHLKRQAPVTADLKLREVDELMEEANGCLEKAKEGLERGWASAAAVQKHLQAKKAQAQGKTTAAAAGSSGGGAAKPAGASFGHNKPAKPVQNQKRPRN